MTKNMKKKNVKKYEFKSSPSLTFLQRLNKEKKARRELERIIIEKKQKEKILRGTLIIGARGLDGIVLGADRKVMRGGESDFERGIEQHPKWK